MHRLLNISIAVMEKFLGFLDENQGEMLRDFSRVATPIVDCIFRGNIYQEEIALEKVSRDDIAGLPRGSSLLLSCFAKDSR